MVKSIDVIRSLSFLPADDMNFKSDLQRATANQIRIAIGFMERDGGQHKTRIAACKRELRRRDSIANMGKEDH